MSSNLLFRVDSSKSIGVGHATRCIALAHMLKEDFTISFFSKDLVKALETEIKGAGWALFKIENEQSFFDEINDGDIIVLDGYHFTLEYQKKIKEVGALLCFIDDLVVQVSNADMVINYCPGIATHQYKSAPYTRFLLGPEFVLLRPLFLQQARMRRTIASVESVLICFGGADPKNLTEQALDVVCRMPQFRRISVVTGPAYQSQSHISDYLLTDSRIVHYSSVTEAQMLTLMSQSDLAIVPASGVLLEALSVGCIIISGFYTENQRSNYNNFLSANFFIDAGGFSDEELTIAINRAFAATSRVGPFDGASGTRLRRAFHFLSLRSKIKLRDAEPSDVDVTFSWASDSSIRAFSFTQHKITWREHVQWFQSKLEDRDCVYLLAELGGQLVGSVRFDISEQQAIINYLVSPQFQGNGVGQAILTNGLEILFTRQAHLKKVIGYVMKSNGASIRIFLNLGFLIREFDNDTLMFEKDIYDEVILNK